MKTLLETINPLLLQLLPGPKLCTSEAPHRCKLCNGKAARIGAVDFNRTNLDPSPFPHAGIDVGYCQCRKCGFAWAPMLDAWSDADFRRYIYNPAIQLIETPENAAQRSDNIISLLKRWFPGRDRLRFLDYGCGPGELTEKLRAEGFDAVGYDRFYSGFEQRPQTTFDVVTCFEVMEHISRPAREVKDLLSFLAPHGVVVMGTFLTPIPMRLDWWYVSPRSGHISFYTVAALKELYGKCGCHVASDGNLIHLAYRNPKSELIRNILGDRGRPV